MIVRLRPSIHVSRLQAIKAALDAGATPGALKIYTAPMPANLGDSVTTQLHLLTYALQKPCGSITDNLLTFVELGASLALADGIAAWGRWEDGNGLAVADGDVSEADAWIILDHVHLFAGGLVTCLSATLTEPY